MSGPTSDTEVPAFWRGLGLPGLADSHVHFLPPRMLRRVWEQSAEVADPTADTALSRSGTARPIIYKWSDEERVEHLRTMGVRAFTALAYAHRPGLAADLNAWTLDFAARTPGCVASGTFYPEPGVNRYTRTALDAGAHIFEVHFEAGDFSPAHALLDAVWAVLAEAGIPVVVHGGSGQLGSVHTGPDPFSAVLRRHPRLTAIVTHVGAPEYVGFLELAEKYERVCLDTSMGFIKLFEQQNPAHRAQLPRLRDLGLAGKVLLGTDFPNLSHSYAEQLAGLAELDLGDDWLRAVCWYNAANLLQLS
jgi:predicted TIM-barrel fold metal-dependent hydrolase